MYFRESYRSLRFRIGLRRPLRGWCKEVDEGYKRDRNRLLRPGMHCCDPAVDGGAAKNFCLHWARECGELKLKDSAQHTIYDAQQQSGGEVFYKEPLWVSYYRLWRGNTGDVTTLLPFVLYRHPHQLAAKNVQAAEPARYPGAGESSSVPVTASTATGLGPMKLVPTSTACTKPVQPEMSGEHAQGATSMTAGNAGSGEKIAVVHQPVPDEKLQFRHQLPVPVGSPRTTAQAARSIYHNQCAAPYDMRIWCTNPDSDGEAQ